MRADVRFDIKGMDVLNGQLAAMRGFQKGATRTAKKAMQIAVVPDLKAAAPRGAKHRGAPGKRGRTGPVARNITVRNAKKRSGEIFALNAGPRAWWAHFGIGGTKDHLIRAGGRGMPMRNTLGEYITDTDNRSSRESRRQNRAHGNRALVVDGRFYSVVWVRGVKANDWVGRASRNQAERALHLLAFATLPRRNGHGLQGD